MNRRQFLKRAGIALALVVAPVKWAGQQAGGLIPTCYWPGNAEVRFWERALTGTEIITLTIEGGEGYAEAIRATAPDSLVFYWNGEDIDE